MADTALAFAGLITNLSMLTNLLMAMMMIAALAMIAYPDPNVRHNGIIAFLATLLAAAITNLPISVA